MLSFLVLVGAVMYCAKSKFHQGALVSAAMIYMQFAIFVVTLPPDFQVELPGASYLAGHKLFYYLVFIICPGLALVAARQMDPEGSEEAAKTRHICVFLFSALLLLGLANLLMSGELLKRR